MDKIIQSRINRSLVIHGLENLVFEKRQRKTIQQLPHIIPNNFPQQKLKNKHSHSHQKLAASPKKPEALPKKQGKPPQKKPPQNRGQKQKKQSKRKPEQSEQEQVKRQVEPIVRNQAKKSAKFERIHKKASIPDKKKTPTQIKKDLTINQPAENMAQEKKDDEELVDDELNNLAKQQYPQSKTDLAQPMKMMQEQPPNEEQIPVLQIAQNLMTKSLPPSDQLINQEMNGESVSDGEKQMALNTTDKLKPRDRRAKLNSFKNYIENDEDFDEEESYQEDKSSKKKKISKSSRSRNGNKPYSLNRIFRKEAKRYFSSFSLDLDFNKISLASFSKELGMFDLVHFSLPISYLNLFPEIVNIIQKGFIFVWVEQGETQIGYHLLNRWGFDIVDQLIWIKANQDQNKIEADNVDICNSILDTNEEIHKPKQLFVNSKSTCLVGYRCPLGNKAEYRTKVSNNVIFAKSMSGLSKPAQIYEIADLMMPGAKKLQFGGEAQKGWLNLKHHQKTLYRCNVCLSEQKLFILLEEKSKPVQCKKCIVNDLKIDLETEQVEVITQNYQALRKIKINSVSYDQDSKQFTCRKCQKGAQDFSFDGLVMPLSQDEGICYGKNAHYIDCFHASQKKSPTSEVKILVKKQQRYMNSDLTCSQCGILSIYDVYFECGKCKNHIICKSCFWKEKKQDDSKNNSSSEETKKAAKKEFMHQWKLKFVKTIPLMKFACFGCKTDLSIPFWGCESCQNWFWCGKCDRGTSQNHPHYQTTQHKQYIMM